MPIRRHLPGLGLSHVQTLNDGVYHTYHQDEQGSTAYITGNEGTVENSYIYDAFGNVLESRENIKNRILYTGQQYDQETGQYYLRARYYNPVTGRFTQEDTCRGDGLNLYAYCGNNPVMYYDPSGHNGCDTSTSKEPEKPKTASESGKATIKSQIQGLKSKTPQQLLDDGWQDITDPRMAANTTSLDLYNPETGLKIRFDKGVEGASGFEAIDHYHIYNNNYTNKDSDKAEADIDYDTILEMSYSNEVLKIVLADDEVSIITFKCNTVKFT